MVYNPKSLNNYKIVVYRTRIEINNYTLGECPKLEKTFSEWDPVRHKSYPFGIIYDENRKVLIVPRGIDVYWLENLFNCKAHVDQTIDPYLEMQANIKYRPRDDVQETALRFMNGINEYRNNKNYTMLSVNLSTGKGKSFCSIATMVLQGIKSIVIAGVNDWLIQWKNYIVEYTDITEDEVCIISGSNAIAKLMKLGGDKYKIFLVNHSTLNSYAKRNGWEAIHELFIRLGIGMKFYDEAHLNFENVYRIDYCTNTYMTYYITATPDRSSSSQSYIYKNYFRNVPSIELFDSDRDPHTAYNAILFNSHPTAMEAQSCKNSYGLNRIQYVNYITEKEVFYNLLYILICMSLRKNGKTLIYIGINRGIEKVKAWIEDTFPNLIGMVGVYTSLTPSEIKKNELSKKIILSTTKSAGAAVDIEGLVQTINAAEPFKSRVLAQQTLGRTRADNTAYIDCVDTGFYHTKKYYDIKKPVYLKYASKCTEIALKDKDLSERYNKEMEWFGSMIQPLEFYDENHLYQPVEYFEDVE